MRKKRAMKWLPSRMARRGYHWIPGVEGLRGKHGIRGFYLEARKALLLTQVYEAPVLTLLMNVGELRQRREQVRKEYLMALEKARLNY